MVTVIDKNTALVLIDLQKGIVSSPLSQPVQPVLYNTAKLIAAFHAADLPVVIVNVNMSGATWTKVRVQAKSPASSQTPEEATAWLKNFMEITPEVSSITTDQDIFITKHTWNAFYGTALHEELQKRNTTGIVLAGISTSIGVEGTARNATELGYNISFAEDALNDSNGAAHAHSLQNIFPRIGEIDTTDGIVKKLSERER
jgi:nicotinamidase-related amidase